MNRWGWRDYGFCLLVVWTALAWRDFGGCRREPKRAEAAPAGAWTYRLVCPSLGVNVDVERATPSGHELLNVSSIYHARGKDGKRYAAPVAACVVVQTWVKQ